MGGSRPTTGAAFDDAYRESNPSPRDSPRGSGSWSQRRRRKVARDRTRGSPRADDGRFLGSGQRSQARRSASIRRLCRRKNEACPVNRNHERLLGQMGEAC